MASKEETTGKDVLGCRSEIYSDEDMRRIVCSVGSSPKSPSIPELRDALTNCAEEFLFRKETEQGPTPSAKKRELENIQKAATKLLEKLGAGAEGDSTEQMPSRLRGSLTSAANVSAEDVNGFPDFPPEQFEIDGSKFWDFRGSEALAAAVLGVQRLRQWADAGAQVQVAVSKNLSLEPRHKGDQDLNRLIEHLEKVYEEQFGRPAGISRPADGGPHGGPWLRFLGACLRPLGITAENSALRERYRRMRNPGLDKRGPIRRLLDEL